MKVKKIATLILATLLITPAVAQNVNEKAFTQTPDPVNANKTINIVPTAAQADIYNINPSPSYQSPYSVTVWVNHQNNVYRIGDKILISVKANRDGYLTLLDINSAGETRVIFPNRYQTNNYVRKGQQLTIPSNNNFEFVISGPTGNELIKAFITSHPTNFFGKNMLSDEAFPLIKSPARELAKTINVVVNSQQQSGNDWGAYNKLIHIVPNYATAPSPRPTNTGYIGQEVRLNPAQIRDIQRTLKQLGYYRSSIDGVIGSGTRQAILRWQRDVGLNPTGYIDSESFTRLSR